MFPVLGVEQNEVGKQPNFLLSPGSWGAGAVEGVSRSGTILGTESSHKLPTRGQVAMQILSYGNHISYFPS